MRRKFLAALSLVLVLAMIPTFAFASGSKSNSGGGGRDRGSSSVKTTVSATGPAQGSGSSGTSYAGTSTETKTLSNGTIIATTGATYDKSSTKYSFAVNTTTSNGTQITSNGDGSVSVGNVKVYFASGVAETAGLPEHIVGNIDALNAGNAASDVLGKAELKDYQAVGCTRAVILSDQTTGQMTTGCEFLMDAGITDAAGQYAVAYYDNQTGLWNYVPVTVDPTTNLIRMYLPGSCTIQLLKKN